MVKISEQLDFLRQFEKYSNCDNICVQTWKHNIIDKEDTLFPNYSPKFTFRMVAGRIRETEKKEN